MFLSLTHYKLDIYQVSRELVFECYKLTNSFPSSERFGLTSQIRRAAVSVFLNVSEGCSRRTETERKRFFEIARGSVIEVDSAFDISNKLGYLKDQQLQSLSNYINRCFQMLSRLT
ncbi:MAG: four helix bundle protein [Proteobacteria bacterium]|nr:MAG: four helix bundle protein [Pseudomonadota bacterium]